MGLTVKIAGVDCSILNGSINTDAAVGQRASASVRVRSSKATVAIGSELGIYTTWTGGFSRVFGGIIYDIRKSRLLKGSTEVLYECSAVSWEYRLDRRFITYAQFSGKNAGQVAQELLSTYATGDVETVDLVENGATAEELGTIIFQNCSVSSALDELCSRSGGGMIWYLTPDCGFVMTKKASIANSPLVINSTNKNYRNPVVQESLDNYFNKVSIEISPEAFPVTEKVFAGDGATRSWQLDSDALQVTEIDLNGVPQDIGNSPVEGDTAKDFTWNPGTKTITQAGTLPLLTVDDELKVKYYPVGRNIIQVNDATDIAARQAISGGSGVVEAFLSDPECRDAVAATNKASRFLDLHCPRRMGAAAGSAPLEYVVEVDSRLTNAGDIRPGIVVQLTVSTPSTGIRNILVTKVSGQQKHSMVDGAYLTYTLTGVEYGPIPDALDFWRESNGSGGAGSNFDFNSLPPLGNGLTVVNGKLAFDFGGTQVTVGEDGKLQIGGVDLSAALRFSDQFTYQTVGNAKVAVISGIAAEVVLTGTLGAGVIYAGKINASQMNAGTLNVGLGNDKAGQIAVFSAAGTSGANLIGWIGAATVSGSTYKGGWFKELYVGGSSPLDAPLVALDGAVTLNGATFTLSLNSITTTINNVVDAVSGRTISLRSSDGTSLTDIAPGGIRVWTGALAGGFIDLSRTGGLVFNASLEDRVVLSSSGLSMNISSTQKSISLDLANGTVSASHAITTNGYVSGTTVNVGAGGFRVSAGKLQWSSNRSTWADFGTVSGGGAISASVYVSDNAASDTRLSMFADAGGFGAIDAENIANTVKKNLALSPWGGNVIVGSTSDNGYKFQVAGNSYYDGQLVIRTPAGMNDSIRIQPVDDLNPDYSVITVGNPAWNAWPFIVTKRGYVTAARLGSTESIYYGDNVFGGGSGSGGFINLINGGASNIGLVEFRKPNTTRAGYIGYGSDGISIVVESGDVTISGTTNQVGTFNVVTNGGGGYVAISPGGSNAGYISWYAANGSRLAYMGYYNSGDMELTLDSASTFKVRGSVTSTDRVYDVDGQLAAKSWVSGEFQTSIFTATSGLYQPKGNYVSTVTTPGGVASLSNSNGNLVWTAPLGATGTCADINHNHNASYSAIGHNHDGVYAAAGSYYTVPVGETVALRSWVTGTFQSDLLTTTNGLYQLKGIYVASNSTPGGISTLTNSNGRLVWTTPQNATGTCADANHNHDGVYAPNGSYYTVPGGETVALRSWVSGAYQTDLLTVTNALYQSKGTYVATSSNPGGISSLSNSGGLLNWAAPGGASGSCADVNHNHSGVYAVAAHNHSGVYQPVGNYAVIDGSGNLHVPGDVFLGSNNLNSLYAASPYVDMHVAGSAYNHGISHITGLQDALNGKASTSHTHTDKADKSFVDGIYNDIYANGGGWKYDTHLGRYIWAV